MKHKDTDYLYASMRIRANEKNFLTSQKTERMIEAKTPEEAAKVLAESGYGDTPLRSFSEVERAIENQRSETMRLVADITENKGICDVFALKYDFHNVKAIIKSELTGENPERLLSDAGTIPPQRLLQAMSSGDLSALPVKLADAISSARETLAHTGDPQPADFILDRVCFEMQADAANDAGSDFLTGYVRLSIDAANLRTAVRTARQGRGQDVLRKALIRGGNIPEDAYLSPNYSETFSGSELSSAAEYGEAVASGKSGFKEFERELSNALIRYMQSAKYAAFDERPIAAYIAAKEAEGVAVRIIMAGKFEGLSSDEIRSRLRLSYV